jgi:hypothetical protein
MRKAPRTRKKHFVRATTILLLYYIIALFQKAVYSANIFYVRE